MKIHNNFIGNDSTNTIKLFEPGDTEERYLENVQKMDDDWYYKNLEITYSLNENGHRCKSIQDLNLDNYIILAGCSHTFGIGLELEKTYAYLLSNKLNCDYYNLAMPGAGIDVMENNILTWFGKIKQKPKLVIIQTPDDTRYCNFNPHVNNATFIERGSWVSDPDEQKMVVNCESTGVFNARKVFVYKNISNILGDVPCILFNVAGLRNIDVTTGLKMRVLDYARDLIHYGILSNAKLSTDMYEHIRLNTKCLNF
jgi:hypothetical protein